VSSFPAGRPARQPLDAYCTTGPSPTARSRCVATVHLLGPGAVGRALLARLAEHGLRLVAVTDTSGSLLDPQGIDPVHVGALKAAGGRVADLRGARGLDIADALEGGRADIVIDATTTRFDRPAWARDLERGALARGAGLALAAKDAVCRAADRWLAGTTATRVGVNAVLGGTGRAFVAVLPALRGACRSIALAGSASTTTVLETIEAGGTLEDGLAMARARGFLETDPELDLRGADAAVKLAIVAGAVLGRSVDPGAIPCTDLRNLDPRYVRDRATDGLTTRLVARLHADGTLACAYEALPAGAPLAAPVGRVAYVYTLADGTELVHEAGGLGADGTADALLADVLALAGGAGTRLAGGTAQDKGARTAAGATAGGAR
jgi:homoserine dehydrogenase